MPSLITWIDTLNDRIGHAVSWLTLFMVVVTSVVVALRHLFNIGWIAMQESVTVMHALLFMLGVAYTLRHEGHVRVDLLYNGLSPRGRARVDLLGALLLLLPTCVFLFWMSWDYVAASWAIHEGSREAGGLPGVWLVKGVMLVMPVLLLLQGLAQAGRAWLRLKGEA